MGICARSKTAYIPLTLELGASRRLCVDRSDLSEVKDGGSLEALAQPAAGSPEAIQL